MVAPTSCSCGKVNILLYLYKDKKLCKDCFKKEKNADREANLAKEKAAHDEAVARKEKAATESAAKTTV